MEKDMSTEITKAAIAIVMSQNRRLKQKDGR